MTEADRLLLSATGTHWRQVGVRNHHGIDLPLFSLHSHQSAGIGEYPDLLPLLSWCKEIGFDVIQLLPLNDLGKGTSPYSAISAFALNPLFLGLAQLPYLDQLSQLLEKLAVLQQLCQTQCIDYVRVQTEKELFLKEYYAHCSEKLLAEEGYHQFLNANRDWLDSYALFKVLKEQHNWSNWEEWEPKYRDPTPEGFQQLLVEHAAALKFHSLIQYLCWQQMAHVHNKAKELGIFIKGDIPILISRDSDDVWSHRHLFMMEYSAGSQPDMYSAVGQNWGFPIYNWSAHEQEKYHWWERRLQVASAFYDIYRLDHLVGFYRIWSIPVGQPSSQGHYIPEDPNVWVSSGEKIMRVMLEKSSLFPIGEDLGVVPPEVRVNLKDLGICGTKVIRWERFWHDPGQPFIPFSSYLNASMTTVSTHDSETLQLWWKNNPVEAQEFARFKNWVYTDVLKSEQQREILVDSHRTSSLFHINLLQEYLVLIPSFAWPNPEDERINISGTISDRNWTYRFRPSVEEIVTSAELTHLMKEMRSD